MSREKRHILIALAIAFVARLAMYPFAGIEKPEFFEYGTIASMLASGQGYTMVHAVADQFLTVPSAWMPPGQTLIIATFFWLFGESPIAYHLIFILNAALGTAAVYFLGRIVRLIRGTRRSEEITMYAAAIFPPFISTTTTWGIASTMLLLNALLVYLALRFSLALSEEKQRLKYAVAFGILGGVMANFRSEAPVVVLFIVIAVLIYHRTRVAIAMKYLIATVTVAGCIVAPWLIANYARFDRFVPGSTSGGFNLWRGNNPIASGGGWTAEGKLVVSGYELQSEILRSMGAFEPREFEFKYSEQFAQRAVEWIQHNPGTFIGLALKKAVLIWVADPYHWSNIKYVYAFFQVIAFGLGLIGVLSLRRQLSSAPLEHWLWIAGAACLASTLITMVFFSLPRYQIFLVGIYFPMVALGVEDVLMRWEAKRQKSNLPATEFAAN